MQINNVKNHSKLGKKLLVRIIMFSTAITIVTSSIQLYIEYVQDRNKLNEEINQIELLHIKPLTESVWLYSEQLVLANLNALLGISGVEHLTVMINDQPQWQVGTPSKQAVIIHELPLNYEQFHQQQKIGILRITTSLKDIYSRLLSKALLILVSNGIKTFLVAAFILFIISRLLTQRLASLSEFSCHNDIDQLDERFEFTKSGKKPNSPDELDILLDSFNSMRQHLNQSIQDKLLAQKEADRAEIMSETKGTFLANMSHEIRTPMNAILGFTDILAGLEKNPEKIHYINNINIASTILLNLINDILDMSKIESGKMTLQYSDVSLKALYKNIYSLFFEKMNEKGLDFIIDIHEDVPNSLSMDEVRLQQVLINLVGNALKFTHTGFVKLDVTVDSKPDQTDGYVDLIFNVSDSGIGIAEDQQTKIFNSFEQAKGQKIKDYGGTGLGLSIVLSIIEIMKGSILVNSLEGQGTSFTFSIPNIEIKTKEALEKSEHSNVDINISATAESSVMPIVLPSLDIINELHSLAFDGYIDDIQDILSTLETDFPVFYSQFKDLALDYKDEEITHQLAFIIQSLES